jgi:hypothetical protein
MNRVTSDPNTGAASAYAGRRHFFMQAGAGASAIERQHHPVSQAT